LVGGGTSDLAIFEANLADATRGILGGLPGASIYRIQLVLSDDLLHGSGTEEVTYTNTEAVPLHDVRFRLFPNILAGEMTIEMITVDGQGTTATLGLEGSLLIVPLQDALKPGESVAIRIEFEERIADEVARNYGVQAFHGGILTLAHGYPMIAVYDVSGWNAEIPPAAGDLVFADMSYFIVKVSAPENITLVGSGSEVRREHQGSRQLVTFAAGPVRDFYLAAGEAWQVHSRETGGVTLRVYAPDNLAAGALAALGYAERALEEFGARYAPYPYAEMEIVATPTLALGIEYPGVVAIADRILTPEDTRLEATVVHEIAHQWFYNLVGNDQLDHPWLDESLAQFATLQYFEGRYGRAGAVAFRGSLEARWERVGLAEIPVGLPVARYGVQEYGAIVYGRGPLFFEALRNELGTTAFDQFMRQYSANFAWGIATPAGLQQTAEGSCECDLQALFDAWIE
jgi:hypothetical protein